MAAYSLPTTQGSELKVIETRLGSIIRAPTPSEVVARVHIRSTCRSPALIRRSIDRVFFSPGDPVKEIRCRFGHVLKNIAA